MKKIAFVLVMLCAVLAFSACRKTEYPTFEEKGMEIVGIIEEMINSEEYLEMYGMPDNVMNVIYSAAEGDYSEAEHIYEIKFSDDIADTLSIEDMLNIELDDLPKSLQKMMKAKLPSAFITSLNNTAGTSAIAAASLTTAGTMFLTDEDESAIYIYTFDEGTPIAVTFVVNDESICQASGTFLLAETLDFSSASALEDSLDGKADVKRIK